MTKAVHGHAAASNVFAELGMPRSTPVSVVELSISCRNLADMDVFSKSDPMVVLYTQQFGSDHWREFGRTEIIWNNLNPRFVRKFVLEYFFEESQKLLFEVYDADSKSPDLSKHDFIGRAECTMGEIVTSGVLKRNLKKRDGRGAKGVIVLSAEELQNCKEELVMQWCGRKLDKKDFFGKSDPFLLFYRKNEDNTMTVVHKTEAIKTTLNPAWLPFTISARTLCNGDQDRPIVVKCFDWNKNGSHALIGEFTTTMRELAQGPGSSNNYELINPQKKARKGSKYHHSGIAELTIGRVQVCHSFLDFIQGGCQIQCIIAIDFTASNGDPRQPTSLHYNNPYKPNEYQTALRAVGSIIQDYDSDKVFPALGFGARLPPDGRISHEFSLNGNPANPNCEGIEGVVQAYAMTFFS